MKNRGKHKEAVGKMFNTGKFRKIIVFCFNNYCDSVKVHVEV